MNLEAKVFNVFQKTPDRVAILYRLMDIQKDLKTEWISILCPEWMCPHCYYLFPKANQNACPCQVYGNKKYLKKRLSKIIEFWQKNINETEAENEI